MNEMRKRTAKNKFEDLIQLLNTRKRSGLTEVATPNNEPPPAIDYEDYEMTTRDYSADWSQYDTWGFDGILKKKKRNAPVNNHLTKVLEAVKRGLGSFLS